MKKSMIGTTEFSVRITRTYGHHCPMTLVVRGKNEDEAKARAVREVWGPYAFLDNDTNQVRWNNHADPRYSKTRHKFADTVPITGVVKICVMESTNG